LASGKYATAIDDRSGFKYPWKDLVREPGTGWMVHKSESDGQYSLVDHPQNFVRASRTESIGLAWARPDPANTPYASPLDYEFVSETVSIYYDYGFVSESYILRELDYESIA